jgi:hypothetical protein
MYSCGVSLFVVSNKCFPEREWQVLSAMAARYKPEKLVSLLAIGQHEQIKT